MPRFAFLVAGGSGVLVEVLTDVVIEEEDLIVLENLTALVDAGREEVVILVVYLTFSVRLQHQRGGLL